MLKENLETSSKNLENISPNIPTVAQSSSKEPIYFDYGLRNHTLSGWKTVKFDIPRAVSPTKIYDSLTGKVTLEEPGLYYFYFHTLPYDKRGSFYIHLKVDSERACEVQKAEGIKHNMSCAIIRYLKRGQQIFVTTSAKIFNSYYSHTGFLGFKLQ